jgi:tetratricopeptide (TPR) repeat protein
MYKPPSTKTSGGVANAQQMSRSAVSEIIRQAEKQIAAQEFQRAQDLLSEAWRLDPGNLYIPAIVERVQVLQSLLREVVQQASVHDNPSSLPITVGNQFHTGIRQVKKPLSNQESEARIRRLLTAAISLYERGAYVSAFETVLKAEEINPQDPNVMEWKQKVSSAHEGSISRRSSAEAMRPREDLPGVAAAMAAKLLSKDPSQNAQLASPGGDYSTFNERLAALRRQREEERSARERTLWQQASMASKKNLGADPKPKQPTANLPQPVERTKNGVISSLLRRKLFE